MVIFRVDGNGQIGVGHFSRCISIAKQLVRLKEKLLFVISPDSDSTMLETNKLPFFRLKQLSDIGWSSDEFVYWLKNNSSNKDIVFLDSYRVRKDDMTKIRKIRKLIYLDDLALFDYPADAIINYNMESTIKQYTPTDYSFRKLFLGTRYFPVREEFKRFQRNEVCKNVSRVLVTSSSTDPDNAILEILKEINVKDFPEIEFLVLEGLFFEANYKEKLHMLAKECSNITFLSWGQNIAKLLSMVDLVICPGSTIMLESFVIGVPCISFSFVDNHIPLCKYCDENGFAPYTGEFKTCSNHINMRYIFDRIIDYRERERIFTNIRQVIDAQGCYRITNVILEEMK